MYKIWLDNPLGIEPSSGSVVLIEIDKSKMISNYNKVYWMFSMFDRATKNAHVFCVLDNRNKETLLPIVAKNVYIFDDIKVNDYESNEI